MNLSFRHLYLPSNTDVLRHYMIEADLGFEESKEFVLRLLRERPWLDPFLTETGAAVLVSLDPAALSENLDEDPEDYKPLEYPPIDPEGESYERELGYPEEESGEEAQNRPQASSEASSEASSKDSWEDSLEDSLEEIDGETSYETASELSLKGPSDKRGLPEEELKDNLLWFFQKTLRNMFRTPDRAPAARLVWLPFGLPESFRAKSFLGPVRLKKNGSSENGSDASDASDASPSSEGLGMSSGSESEEPSEGSNGSEALEDTGYTLASEGSEDSGVSKGSEDSGVSKGFDYSFEEDLYEDLIIKVPEGLKLSPRRQGELSLAAESMADYLTPPPGAPNPKGRKTLIIQEGPAFLPFAASKLGAGEISFAFKGDETKYSLELLKALNEEGEDFVVYQTPLSHLVRIYQEEFSERFGLIATSIAPGLLVRNLRFLAEWLEPLGRIIATGFSGASWTSSLLKAAFRLGLCLKSSVAKGDYCSLDLQKPRRRAFINWEWKPGDWVADLNEDELSALEEAGRLDDSSPPVDDETLDDSLLDYPEDDLEEEAREDASVEEDKEDDEDREDGEDDEDAEDEEDSEDDEDYEDGEDDEDSEDDEDDEDSEDDEDYEDDEDDEDSLDAEDDEDDLKENVAENETYGMIVWESANEEGSQDGSQDILEDSSGGYKIEELLESGISEGGSSYESKEEPPIRDISVKEPDEESKSYNFEGELSEDIPHGEPIQDILPPEIPAGEMEEISSESRKERESAEESENDDHLP